MQIGQRVALAGMLGSGVLALIKLLAGYYGNSTAVIADGLESGADVLGSGFVLFGLTVAARPADEDHPYGHGRFETLTGLCLGLFLTLGGALVSFFSARQIGEPHAGVSTFVVWPLILSMVVKTALAAIKLRYGRRIGSAALTADAWNDAMDTLSAIVALAAVILAISDPSRFADADRYGGCGVGLIVVFAGLRISRESALQLMDTMPDDALIVQIRAVAQGVPEVRGVEKCYARKTGLKYHVDLHLEVDPEMTVRRSHELAHEVQMHITERLSWVADVLVHVEPAP